MSAAVRREEARLRRVFQGAILILSSTPLACGAPESDAAVDLPAAEGGGGAPVSADDAASMLPVTPVEPRAFKSCTPVPFTPDPPDACGRYVRLPCGLPSGVTPANNCYLWLNDCEKVCKGAYFNCHAVGDSCKDGEIVKDAKGGVDIDCATCAKGVGRVPEGLSPAVIEKGRSPIGDYFAAAARLEAAAVHAFRRMRDELGACGAPASLRRAAERARRDEVRHARATARIARRFGGRPARAEVADLPPRPVLAVALENAAEGCVRETFGALVAMHQAAHARDPEIAAAMAEIAADETRHAALSWAVARWASAQVGPEGREAIHARCREAIAELRREAEIPVPAALVEAAGLPDPARQRALLGALADEIWQAWA